MASNEGFSNSGLPAPSFGRGEVARRAGPYASLSLDALLQLVTAAAMTPAGAPDDLEAIVAGVQLRIADGVVAKAGRKVAPTQKVRLRWRLSEADLVERIAWEMIDAILLRPRGGAA